MQVWGLTGNIACGKSAVEGMLRDRGVPVIDADVVARQVVEPGRPALDAIEEAFGDGVIRDGRLDRPALGRIVFSDSDKRRQLEAITHPAIHAEIARQVFAFAAEGHELVVVSAALMVESGSAKNYAGVVVVTCPADEQLRRLLGRDDLTEDEARARIASQMAQDEKASHGDFVVQNGGDLPATRAQVEAWIATLPPGLVPA